MAILLIGSIEERESEWNAQLKVPVKKFVNKLNMYSKNE